MKDITPNASNQQQLSQTKAFLNKQLLDLEDLKSKVFKQQAKEDIKYQVENFIPAVFVKVVQKENQLFERINGVEEQEESLEETEIKNELQKLFQDFY